MAIKLGFFTPVNYLNSDNGTFKSLRQAAEDYFDYGLQNQRAFVIKAENKAYDVQLINCKSNLLTTALKIITLTIPVIPLIMLTIKIASRFEKKFNVVSIIDRKTAYAVLTPQRKSTYDPLASYKKYTKIFANAGLDYSTATPIQKHSAFFADEKGNITRKSLQNGLERLKIGKINAIIESIGVFRAISALAGKVDGVIRLADIAKAKHPCNTQIFTKTGDLELSHFDVFRRFAKTVPGMITIDELSEMRAANRKRDASLPNFLIGAAGSRGEFNLTVNLFGNRFVIDQYGKAVPAITFEQLLKVYTHGPELFEEASS